jgi:SAM-dependent methyltransferase
MDGLTGWQAQAVAVDRAAAGTAFNRRDRLITDHLATLPSDALVVNVGCGRLRRLEAECRSRYVATDILPLPSVDFAADAAALPLPAGCADTVIALELLEHVPRPQAVLAEIVRLLAPGGTAFVSVPSSAPRHEDPDFWRFTAQGLAQLGSEVFDESTVLVIGGTFEALGYLGSYYLALGLARVGLANRRLKRSVPALGRRLDRRAPWSVSTSALHTLAVDLLLVGTVGHDGKTLAGSTADHDLVSTPETDRRSERAR